MKISFYEEFPTEENPDKLRFVGFRTRIIVACKGLEEFRSIGKRILQRFKNVSSVAFWPTLAEEDGYWLSPFSRNLDRLIEDLKENKRPLELMWDAELPVFRKLLFITELPKFISNKKLIRRFLRDAPLHNISVETSEYETDGHITRKIMESLCLTFDPQKYPHKKIGMMYTSMIKSHPVERYLETQLDRSKKIYGDSLSVGLGVIAKGVADENILSPDELDRDLRMLKKQGIDEAVIFRLGGMDERYAKVIKRYSG